MSLSSTSSQLIIPQSLSPYTIPVSTYISTHSSPLVGVVGAAVRIHQNKVLLIQRVPGDDCPNLWEVPGVLLISKKPFLTAWSGSFARKPAYKPLV
ncbi:uncharacterized protein BO80DRAFT_425102 [Aspergillus ibericus CBS 121593]|uniref:Nudix hydrolase domain-containing protein n=1 Tax=Aspergillus ibericus CBS 121593 TaxID=1448316 RepID=A0A395H1P3_9EURO|nr:hypothetical protein BO80DRAFT_425102 [Aspergillus ibericus CBS 121593]RAL01135.1 hypothetical protein BO80DRAFT_425102 [Aspergillus ibericus CBS 121593]